MENYFLCLQNYKEKVESEQIFIKKKKCLT